MGLPVMPEPLDGLAAADAHLGRRFPLPAAPLPLTRWVEVRAIGEGAEVELNLDDSRAGAPGRLALYAGRVPPPDQLTATAGPVEQTTVRGLTLRRAPLADAQPSLKPVIEVGWMAGGLSLRLTAQGPWALEDVLAIVAAVAV
jgi:hypothetical protein